VTIEETMFMLTESSDFYVVNCWFEALKRNTTSITSRLKVVNLPKRQVPFSNLLSLMMKCLQEKASTILRRRKKGEELRKKG
jgi:hypothetical protein